MLAGLDAGGQSAGLALIKKLDPAGLRTVGVLTKVDALHVTGDVRKHIVNTLGGQGYPLKNGYFAVTPIAHCIAVINWIVWSCEATVW